MQKRVVLILLLLYVAPVMHASYFYPSIGYPTCGNSCVPPCGDQSQKQVIALLSQIKNCVCPTPITCVQQLQNAVSAFLDSSDAQSEQLRLAVLNATVGQLYLEPALGTCIKQKPIDYCSLILALFEALSDCNSLGICKPLVIDPRILTTTPAFNLVNALVHMVPTCCPQLCCLANVFVQVYEFVVAEVVLVEPCEAVIAGILDILSKRINDIILRPDLLDKEVCKMIREMRQYLHSSAVDSCPITSNPAIKALHKALGEVRRECCLPADRDIDLDTDPDLDRDLDLDSVS
jgi:hypothetical protein